MGLNLPYQDDCQPTGQLVKGRSRASEKRRQDRHEAAVIQAVHDEVFALSSLCAICSDTELESNRKGYRHEMNEDPARSKTRGWPVEDRFNTRICMRICSECHEGYTRNQVRCVPLSSLGFAGDYRVERNLGGKTWVSLFEVRR